MDFKISFITKNYIMCMCIGIFHQNGKSKGETKETKINSYQISLFSWIFTLLTRNDWGKLNYKFNPFFTLRKKHCNPFTVKTDPFPFNFPIILKRPRRPMVLVFVKPFYLWVFIYPVFISKRLTKSKSAAVLGNKVPSFSIKPKV